MIHRQAQRRKAERAALQAQQELQRRRRAHSKALKLAQADLAEAMASRGPLRQGAELTMLRTEGTAREAQLQGLEAEASELAQEAERLRALAQGQARARRRRQELEEEVPMGLG